MCLPHSKNLKSSPVLTSEGTHLYSLLSNSRYKPFKTPGSECIHPVPIGKDSCGVLCQDCDPRVQGSLLVSCPIFLEPLPRVCCKSARILSQGQEWLYEKIRWSLKSKMCRFSGLLAPSFHPEKVIRLFQSRHHCSKCVRTSLLALQ